MSNARIGVFGEVLFDHFADGSRVLGGAPFNVAWHLQAFGRSPLFVSRVGQDEEGKLITGSMRTWGMDVSAMQLDARRATGMVRVSIENGEPSYDIVSGVAYDAISAAELPEDDIGLLYHGSLALRDATSSEALQTLRERVDGPVFVDVNLRRPWWQFDRIKGLLDRADWAKLNEDELDRLGDGQGPDEFRRRHGLSGLVLTLGEMGASVITDEGDVYVSPEPATEVIDTVGAGDAFTSVFLLGLVRGWPYEQSAARAQRFASAIVGQRGATVSDPAFYSPFIQSWDL